MSFGPFPYLHFVWVSPALEEEIKRSSVRGAIPSLVAAPILGAVVLALDGELMFAKLLQGLCALFVLVAGFYLLTARSCVSSGYLNLTIAAKVRRPLLALSIVEAVLLLLSYLPLAVHATESTDASATSVVLGTLLPILLLGLSVMSYLVARKYLPPRPEVLRKYGLSGEVIGPPTPSGPQQH